MSCYNRAGCDDEDDEEDENDDCDVKFWMLRRLPKFGGAIGEDPVTHVKTFHSICCHMKPKEESLERFKLKLFKLSLTDSAKSWYYSSSADCESNYGDLRAQFLKKFSPPSYRFEIRKKISTFEQFQDETLYDYYLRFDELAGSCPHHGLTDLFLLENFLGGLKLRDSHMLDVAAGGSVMSLHMDDAWDLIDDMTEKSNPRRVQLHQTNDKAQPVEVDLVEIKHDTKLVMIDKQEDSAFLHHPESQSLISNTLFPFSLQVTDSQENISLITNISESVTKEEHGEENLISPHCSDIKQKTVITCNPTFPHISNIFLLSHVQNHSIKEALVNNKVWSMLKNVKIHTQVVRAPKRIRKPKKFLERLCTNWKTRKKCKRVISYVEDNLFFVHADKRYSMFGWKPGWDSRRRVCIKPMKKVKKRRIKFDGVYPWAPNL